MKMGAASVRSFEALHSGGKRVSFGNATLGFKACRSEPANCPCDELFSLLESLLPQLVNLRQVGLGCLLAGEVK